MTTNKPEVVAIKDSDVGGLIELKPVSRLPHGTRLIRLSDYEALQAECEKLRKDAERYQWLRDAGVIEGDVFSSINEWLWAGGDFQEVSSDIDDAMQEGRKP